MGLRRNSFVCFLIVLLAGFAQAQYIGAVSQQTVQTSLATNTLCTSSPQSFVTTGSSGRFRNLGQMQHYLQISNVTGAQFFTAEIDGIDNQGNVYRLSDVLEFAGVSSTRQGSVTGTGSYPQIQVSITCSPTTATFTASYSGSQFSNNVNAGSYLNAQLDKINFANASPTSSEQDNTEPTPFGSSAGTLFVQYSSVPAAGGQITVACTSNSLFASLGAAFQVTFQLATTNGVQIFQVPDRSCPFASVDYVAGTGGTSITSEYIYTYPGRASAVSNASNLTGALNISAELGEKGARWPVSSSPAAGSQATASKAASTLAYRHVADCLSASAGAATAPTATVLTVNLRDGASGAGTVLWTQQITAGATATNHGNINVCGLNLIGSPATAMTLEFSSALASESEAVTLTGYDVQ